MKFANKLFYTVFFAASLSSCASTQSDSTGPNIKDASIPAVASGASDYPVKIGEPYKIGTVSYAPQDIVSYDEVGYASFYGKELSGQPTANGEVFMPGAITAAHKTLPMPSYAEVTALDTGRTILVRINDRGPFVNDRLIDLSSGAAQQLGITNVGVTAVRVRKVNPPEQERTVLRLGQKAAERIETPDSLLRVLRAKLDKIPRPSNARSATIPRAIEPSPAPPPRSVSTSLPETDTQARNDADGRFIREGQYAPRKNMPSKRVVTPPPSPGPMPARDIRKTDGRFVRESEGTYSSAANAPATKASRQAGTYTVQVASFNSRDRAEQYARKIGASVVATDNNIFRVRFGPYGNEADAQRGLATARQRGYPEAKVFRE